ncbi:hypothetical protein B0H63DRAFT_559974 [Podospora didyma]|uniref:Uncharacterized protein n=1 Tax=Podospora didyma TaxID=330526 RepID=A0AAE0NPJ1_9PEZI|nr:hypothetical protein B0H63DRAFT_559974 [Podospora didyma]
MDDTTVTKNGTTTRPASQSSATGGGASGGYWLLLVSETTTAIIAAALSKFPTDPPSPESQPQQQPSLMGSMLSLSSLGLSAPLGSASLTPHDGEATSKPVATVVHTTWSESYADSHEKDVKGAGPSQTRTRAAARGKVRPRKERKAAARVLPIRTVPMSSVPSAERVAMSLVFWTSGSSDQFAASSTIVTESGLSWQPPCVGNGLELGNAGWGKFFMDEESLKGVCLACAGKKHKEPDLVVAQGAV